MKTSRRVYRFTLSWLDKLPVDQCVLRRAYIVHIRPLAVGLIIVLSALHLAFAFSHSYLGSAISLFLRQINSDIGRGCINELCESHSI
jgi:hypothetical protein